MSPPRSRLPDRTYQDAGWRTAALTPDFAVEDVWALPVRGGPHDLPVLAAVMTAPDEPRAAGGGSWAYRFLFAVRWRLGRLLGWDRPDQGTAGRVVSVRDRLPADLLTRRGPDFTDVPMRSVLLTEREWVCEIANATVHSLMHIGWVPTGDGDFTARMTVLVRPHGALGRAYLMAIRPVRLWVVYPALLRGIGRDWDGRSPDAPT